MKQNRILTEEELLALDIETYNLVYLKSNKDSNTSNYKCKYCGRYRFLACICPAGKKEWENTIEEVKSVRLLDGEPLVDYYYIILNTGEIKIEDKYSTDYNEDQLLINKEFKSQWEAKDFLDELINIYLEKSNYIIDIINKTTDYKWAPYIPTIVEK